MTSMSMSKTHPPPPGAPVILLSTEIGEMTAVPACIVKHLDCNCPPCRHAVAQALDWVEATRLALAAMDDAAWDQINPVWQDLAATAATAARQMFENAGRFCGRCGKRLTAPDAGRLCRACSVW